MWQRLYDSVDERLKVKGLVEEMMFEPIIGGVNWLYVLGGTLVFVFIMQGLTGILLALYYAPTPDHAYASIRFIENEVRYGALIRGFHHWNASMMVVVVVLHVLRVFTFAAYKKPREVTWIVGVLLLLTTLGFAFTGYLLPWDQKAYWATKVGVSVAGTVPVLGGFVLRVLQGSATQGAVTLSHFFGVHVLVLPALIVSLIGFHLFCYIRNGESGPWDEKKRKVSAPFVPDQAVLDAVVWIIVFAVVMGLAAFVGAGLEAPANPTDTTYDPRPEWYFLFLFQYIKYFQGPLQPLGTIVIPAIVIAALLLLPFYDRNPSREPRRRPIALGVAAVAVVVIGGLTYLAASAPHTGEGMAAPAPVITAPTAAPGGGPAGAPDGKLVFNSNCSGCHSLDTTQRVGPGLGGLYTRATLPNGKPVDDDNLKGWVRSGGGGMPGFSSLKDDELSALVNYLKGATK